MSGRKPIREWNTLVVFAVVAVILAAPIGLGIAYAWGGCYVHEAFATLPPSAWEGVATAATGIYVFACIGAAIGSIVLLYYHFAPAPKDTGLRGY